MADILTRNQTFATPQEALAHHGVKGMKWGVRNTDRPAGDLGGSSAGPSRREVKRNDKVANLRARAAKADIAAKEFDAAAKAEPDTFVGKWNANQHRNLAAQTRNESKLLNKTADAVESGHLTPGQKQLLVGGGILAAGLLVAYGGSKMQSGEFNALKLRGQAALQGKPFEFARKEKWAGKLSPDEALAMSKSINPNYKVPGGQMNCRRCTFAYELRRRGFDVQATASSLGIGQSESGLINALTPGHKNLTRAQSLSMGVSSGKGIRALARGDSRSNPATLTSIKSATDRLSFLSALKDQPDGARGEAVFNFGAFGHSLAYEKFQGKVYIFDTQKGQRYDVHSEYEYNSFLKKWGHGGGVSNVELTRLDNVALDHNFLARWATNSKGAKP